MSLHLWAVSVTLSGEAGAGGLGEEVSARAATSRGIRGESGDPGLHSGAAAGCVVLGKSVFPSEPKFPHTGKTGLALRGLKF